MQHSKHLSRQDIEDALEEIVGFERWQSIKNLVHVNTIIETSDSVYEAAERIHHSVKSE